ncbi:hypothetical protein [uncultured Helicobacter sp.]
MQELCSCLSGFKAKLLTPPLREHTLSESIRLDSLDSAVSLVALDSIIL